MQGGLSEYRSHIIVRGKWKEKHPMGRVLLDQVCSRSITKLPYPLEELFHIAALTFEMNLSG